MAQVINLRTARKQAARDRKRKDTAASAAQSGRTKADRRIDATLVDKARAHLDGHQISGDDTSSKHPARLGPNVPESQDQGSTS